MAKVIIGIHGLGNKPPKETLENWWKKAMIEGLEKLNKPYDFPQFEMVYWADVLYDKPLDEQIEDSENPFFLNEKYTPGSPDFEPEDNSIRQKVLDFLEGQLDKLFLNDDLTINYTGISDAIIHRYFKDLEIYYAEECFDKNDTRCKARKLIRERLSEVINKYKGYEILLIGHSMGSIVAYDVLTFLLPEVDIHTFITIGSPLGFPVVQGKIAAEWNAKRLVPPKLKTPQGVKKCWYNFADLKDKVALIYQLSNNYKANWKGVKPRDFMVNNDYHVENEFNPHKSFGYLRTSEFSEVLQKFSKEEGFAKKLFSRLYSIFQN
jgi:hypothetical protein